MITSYVSALYGSLFPMESEAAFANYRLWKSIGFIMAFSYSSQFCTSTKLYILTAFLVVGIFMYGVIEWRVKSKLGKPIQESLERYVLPKISMYVFQYIVATKVTGHMLPLI